LFAVLLTVWLAREVWRRKDPKRPPRRVSYAILSSRDFDELNIALESATALNAYNVHAQNDPSVHLRAVVRFTPLDYEGSVHEVMQSFRQGRVVSIDLGKMDNHQAARLVDFCSGLTAADSGWIFHVADRVIVLTPST
jgi:FtsZ-interacting cell division protein YlmF